MSQMVQFRRKSVKPLKAGTLGFLCALTCLFFPTEEAQSQAFFHPLGEQEVKWVRETFQAMKEDPRGPYLRIRWFCSDGSVHPPEGKPCATRGGGVQHAELKESARKLAELDFNVGTIYQALTYEEFIDADQDYYRLNELVLQKYLQDRDNGWIYRRARYYRGARQIEDEQRQGQAFLEKLLSNPDWLRINYLLAVQLVPTVPHQAALEHSSRKIRNLASEIADRDSKFLDLRNKIHSFPSEDDLVSVENYLSSTTHSPELTDKLMGLIQEMRQQYQGGSRLQILQSFQERVGSPLAVPLERLKAALQQKSYRDSYALLAELSLQIRRFVTQGSDGRQNLLLLDLNHLLQEEAFVVAQVVSSERSPKLSRKELLDLLSDHFKLAAGAGFISSRELQALDSVISQLDSKTSLKAAFYKDKVHYLADSLEWARATGRQIFAPVYERYGTVEPLAYGFLDALLRNSVLLPLAADLNLLERDADRVLSQSDTIGNLEVSQGLRGLNPGMAVGLLDILDHPPRGWRPDPAKIYVIPETTPELRPLAGVLTLEAGNLLSHVQLLARSLNLPNASVSPALLPHLRQLQGKKIFYAVTPQGKVILKDVAALNPVEKSFLSERTAHTEKVKLDTSRLDLKRIRPILLHELRSADSGVIVGPKAANLGQLASYFPDRVAPGVALPFGMFVAHVDRPFHSTQSVYHQIRDTFQKAERMRADGVEEREIDTFMFDRLAYFRRAIIELDWKEDLRGLVVGAMEKTFGAEGENGVFVRSDTNVEDLPEFSGAGLNLTIPHQRGLKNILYSIKKVWSSPFSERAYLWRKSILESTEKIYPSVLLLKSIPSEKSGVLITSGVEEGDPTHLTIVTAEGVGGAVEGEAAETLVLAEDGSVQLLSQARSPFQKVLVEDGSGGIALVPSSRRDYLLTEGDIRQLRHIVKELKSKLPPEQQSIVWDIEFGFVKGKVWLFQMRPFIKYRNSQTIERLKALDSGTSEQGEKLISMAEAVLF